MNKRPICDVLTRQALGQGAVPWPINKRPIYEVASDIRALIETESLQSLLGFEPDTEVAIIWSVEDVWEVSPKLTPEQAIQVLRLVKRHHDSNQGVNWDVIESWATHFQKYEKTHTHIA
jgi:hypothetical protein